MRIFLAAIICQLVLCGPLLAAQQTEITGEVAYTEIIQFDYTKDGMRNQVQFWLEFKGSPAMGEPGEEGYIPESGAIYYYLVDVENKKQVDNWLMGFSMMEGPPPSGPYPMSNISIRGNTATFTAFEMRWTVVDGGEGYSKDTVTIDDGFSTRDMKLHNGDMRIVYVDIHDQQCTRAKNNTVGCGECHEPHSDQMAEDTCSMCHPASISTEVIYAFDVPSQHCAACHNEAADVLAARQSKHSDIACALCHQETHKATVTCQYCHGAPHPTHVMKKEGICAACHNTAHDLESARGKQE